MAPARDTRPNDAVHVETTVATRHDAGALAHRVLRERLAACAWQIPVRSQYWWRGKLEAASEVLVVFKTTPRRRRALIARVLALHPYEVPYLRSETMRDVPAPYRAWLRTETARSTRRVPRARR